MLAAGLLDTTFGDGGTVVMEGTPVPIDASETAMIISLNQDDGSIIVVGQSHAPDLYLDGSPSISYLSIVRFLADGSRDMSFGKDGQKLLPRIWGSHAIQQPDGKIAVVGTTVEGQQVVPVALRLHPDGTMDNTFGENGITLIDGIESSGLVSAIDSDGKILVASSSFSDFAVTRLEGDGAVDTAFGIDGVTRSASPEPIDFRDLELLDDGRLVTAGIASHRQSDVIVMFGADGNLDPSFSGDGILAPDLDTTSIILNDLAIVGQGSEQQLVAAGSISDDSSSFDALALKVNLTGELDTSFGTAGWANYDYAAGSDVVSQVTVLDDGSLLLGGHAQSQGDSGYSLAALKVDANGNRDATFGADGWSVVRISGRSDTLQSLTTLNDGSVLIAGRVQTSSFENAHDYAVARLTPLGRVDTSFGDDGFALAKVIVPGYLDGNGQLVTTDLPEGSSLVVGSAAREVAGQSRTYVGVARYAADGSLDTSFGEGGSLLVLPGFSSTAAANQADGKVIVAGSFGGRFAVARLNTNGTGDEEFGDGGIATLNAPNGSARSVAVGSDGKIVVLGLRAVLRLNPDGTIDQSFGANGERILAIGSAQTFATDVALMENGKIVISGHLHPGGDTDAFVLRLNENGSDDESFSDDGVVTYATNDREVLYSVAVHDDGSIVAAGESGIGSTEAMLVLRITEEGSLDTSFGVGGVFVLATENANERDVNLLPDGSVLVVGDNYQSYQSGFVVKLTSQGELDTNFNGGVVRLEGEAGNSLFSHASVRSDGMILIAGATYSTLHRRRDFQIVQLNSDGTVDTGIADDGSVTSGFAVEPLTNEEVRRTQLLPDGRAVTIGFEKGRTGHDVLLRRFLVDGTPDPAFGDSGLVRFPINTRFNLYNDYLADFAIQPDGSIVLAGSYRGSESRVLDWYVVRYDASGQRDTTFGDQGSRTIVLDNDTNFRTDVAGVIIDTEGSIVVGGTDVHLDSSGRSKPYLAVVKLNADGDFETAFGSAGIALIEPATGFQGTSAFELGMDGEIYVAGHGSDEGTYTGVARLSSIGGLDPSYGVNGWATIDSEYRYTYAAKTSLAVDATGRAVLGYSISDNDFDWGLTRFTAAGLADTAFSRNGKAVFGDPNASIGIESITLQENGSVLAAGYRLDTYGRGMPSVYRVANDGTLDTSFGDQGTAGADLGRPFGRYYDVEVGHDSRIVAAGGQKGFEGNDELLLARFTGDNTAPIADAGGPYSVTEQSFVQLSGAGTTDESLSAEELDFVWDLDGDGVFGETGNAALRGDEVGIAPTFFAHGLTGPTSITVDMQATDDVGFTGTATATINIVPAEDDGTVFYVTNTNDSGIGSLRQAILGANATPNGDSPDQIQFNIQATDNGYDPTTESFTIQPESDLPALTDAVLIDGFTQPGASPNSLVDSIDANPLIVLSGSHENDPAGLSLLSDDVTVRGLVIHGFAGPGVYIATGALDAEIAIQGNFIGTDVSGTLAVPNNRETGPFNGTFDAAIWVDSTNGVTVGGTDPADRNLISGNLRSGISVSGTLLRGSARILGNFIGTDVSGSHPLGNEVGIAISRLSSVIGGSTPGAGNVISGNRSHGIQAEGQSVVILGNHIGTDAQGLYAVGNGGDGVRSGVDARIGGVEPGAGNVIAANGGFGIVGRGSLIQGNRIGYDKTGMMTTDANGVPLVNNGLGSRYDVQLGGLEFRPSILGGTASGAGNIVAGNVNIDEESIVLGNTVSYIAVSGGGDVMIGGSTPESANVVASAIDIRGQGKTTVQGNYIGIDPRTEQRIGLGRVLVRGGSSGNVIGTDGDGVGDESEGNVLTFVQLTDVNTSGNRVAGNRIGTTLSGDAPSQDGGWVWIVSGASGNTIGTDGDGISDDLEGNVIAGYVSEPLADIPASVYIDGSDNVIAGNWIGTDKTGTIDLGNSDYGVRIQSSLSDALNNRVGTDGDGVSDDLEGNTIAFAGRDGFATFGFTNGHTVRGNRIYSNGELGIDHDLDGITPNDLDTQSPGNRQNFPELSTVSTGSTTRVMGTLSSLPGTQFLIDFYASDVADPSGHGEGATWIGFAEVVSNASGDATIDTPLPVSIEEGQYVTATATQLVDHDGDPTTALVTRETSEFSLAVKAIESDPSLITVTNTNDSGPGSLREAILRANAFPGENTIQFNIPASDPGALDNDSDGVIDVYRIQPLSPLPAIDDATGGTTIDGRTQSGFADVDRPLVAIDGSNEDRRGTNSSVGGITIRSDDNSLVALNIRNFESAGIVVNGGNRNQIAGNRIGTNETGTAAMANRTGIHLVGSSTENVIGTDGDGVGDADEGNLISGNFDVGVSIVNDANHRNIIAGNLIGVDWTGTTSLANEEGVAIQGPPFFTTADENRIGTNGDGVSDLEERNIISGNKFDGIRIIEYAVNTVVAGNFIGVDLAGDFAIANSTGISDHGQNTRIGTNSDGLADQAEGNVISGNTRQGIWVGSESNATISGNRIGTTSDGSGPLGNRTGVVSANRNGNAKIKDNIIAHNLREGIVRDFRSSTLNPVNWETAIRKNSIYANGALGIDLGVLFTESGTEGDGVTANDVPDADGIQNYPVLSEVVSGTSTRVFGRLDSTPNTSFFIDVYSNDVADPSGYGEGKDYLDFFEVTTDVNGTANFDVTLDVPSRAGAFITTTATKLIDVDGDATTPAVAVNTSEFSLARESIQGIFGADTDFQDLFVDQGNTPDELVVTLLSTDGEQSFTVTADEVVLYGSSEPNFFFLESFETDKRIRIETESGGDFVQVDATGTGSIDIRGGDGRDRVSVAASPLGGTTINLAEGNDGYNFSFPIGQPSGVVTVSDDAGTDRLTATGTAEADRIAKDADSITHELLDVANPVRTVVNYSEIESITIIGGRGNDLIIDPGEDTTLLGGPGDDTIIVTETFGNGIVVDGNEGNDTVIIELGKLAGPVIVLDSGIDETTTVRIVGTPDDDAITLSATEISAGVQTISLDLSTEDINLEIDGGEGTDQITVTEALPEGTELTLDSVTQTAQIDVQPFREVNKTSLGYFQGITVALFTTETFDTADVDLSSVMFAGANVYHSWRRDIDGDGDLDLLLRFRIADTNLRQTYSDMLAADLEDDGVLDSLRKTTSVRLTGQAYNGNSFEGDDTLMMRNHGLALRAILAELFD